MSSNDLMRNVINFNLNFNITHTYISINKNIHIFNTNN